MDHIKLRPNWNELFMRHAILAARRSVCLHRQTGAVIVKDRDIISTGYNGSPPGTKHCYELGGCIRDIEGIASGGNHNICRAIHGEVNAILHSRISTHGSWMYTVYSPCSVCMRIIAGARIVVVYYLKEYIDEITEKIAKESNIKLIDLSLMYPHLLEYVNKELHPMEFDPGDKVTKEELNYFGK